MFLSDSIIIFNSAVINQDDFSIIDDRGRIASIYLHGWFTVDILSIVPFDIILSSSSGNMNNMIKLVRIGRMYKLVKLTRLLKMLKLVKDRSKILKIVNETLKVGVGFERLFFFIMMFIMMSHIVSCLWVLAATIYDSSEGTWIERFGNMSGVELYLTSLYYTIETISTVGYGDLDVRSPIEKIFCIFTMIIGVVAFTFASGSLASIL